MGTGGDYAAIQVFELPSFEQVAEWHHNTTPMNHQVRILQQYQQAHTRHNNGKRYNSASPQIFYSMENNSIGEAALT